MLSISCIFSYKINIGVKANGRIFNDSDIDLKTWYSLNDASKLNMEHSRDSHHCTKNNMVNSKT